MNVQELAQRYVEAWATTERDARHALVTELYGPQANFYAGQPQDLHLTGTAAIEQNIQAVNERDVQGNHLRVRFDSATPNNHTLKVSWQLLAPDDAVAANGTDVLFLDPEGKITDDFLYLSR